MNNRQSFLGDNLDEILENIQIAVIGLGCGGSQVVQQLTHIGFKKFILCDYYYLEDTNLNRTVGSTLKDVEIASSKMSIAVRLIKGISPNAEITEINSKFQVDPKSISQSNVIFGCVDGLCNRNELEKFARRNKIPYIDIGMDVTKPSGLPVMRGQIIASLPEKPCMWCFGFITPEQLEKEAAAYDQAGVRPQVIWQIGVLASTAVHILMNLLTNWTRTIDLQTLYYEYDGNKGTVRPHVHYDMNKYKTCDHHSY
jgi:molybdopterin-synthase adenylyltransferase